MNEEGRMGPASSGQSRCPKRRLLAFPLFVRKEAFDRRCDVALNGRSLTYSSIA